MADADLKIKRGGGVIQTQRYGGAQSQNIFFSALRASVWAKNKRGGGVPGPPGASTGSTTAEGLSFPCYQRYLKARENREEGKRPLPALDAFFHLATDHICGRTWCLKPVSFNLEYACVVQTLRWEFLSSRLNI